MLSLPPGLRGCGVGQAPLERAEGAPDLIKLLLRVPYELGDLADLVSRGLGIGGDGGCAGALALVGHHTVVLPGDDYRPVNVFALQFPAEDIEALAARFPGSDDTRLMTLGAAVRARGHYTRLEFIEVCAWKTPRSRPRIVANSAAMVIEATARAIDASDEGTRIAALLELQGVGVPTASTLLFAAFPDDYPILDVRALESLGVKGRSTYPVSFWLAYLGACRRLAREAGVSLRTLDKALWQRSKELSVGPAGGETEWRHSA